MRKARGVALSMVGLLLSIGIPIVAAAPRQEACVRGAGQEGEAAVVGTLIGDVLIETDVRGRVVVVLDEASAGSMPDGVADRAFILESGQPVFVPVHERIRLASVIVGRGSLHVSSPETGFTVDLAVSGGGEPTRVIGSDRIVLHDGVALQSRRLDRAEGALEHVRPEQWTVVEPAEPDGSRLLSLANGCQSGGEGATSCSTTCGFTSASVGKTSECEVTCGRGFYACCKCNWLYKATCTCKRAGQGSEEAEPAPSPGSDL